MVQQRTRSKIADAKTKHEDRYRIALRTGRCPTCGARLGAGNILRDRGWRYGIECDQCR